MIELIKEELELDKEVIILIVEDDDGHATLINRNLRRIGIKNDLKRFANGQEVLDFLFDPNLDGSKSYLILLDIRMPKVDGLEVLRQIKADDKLSKIPVIMLTTTDDPREVNTCHKLGCNNYITKPVDYQKFVDALKQLGLFLNIVETPTINGDD
ncbi:MAG: response regulator [Bacillota bacterium]